MPQFFILLGNCWACLACAFSANNSGFVTEKKTNLDATLALYYEHAIQFDNAKLMDAVLTTCSDPLVFWSLTAESAIFRIPDPRLCLHLVQQVGGRGDASIRSSTNNSDRLSQLVASFCSQHFVNPATFARLTDPLTMPTITTVSSQVALSLLKLECAILGGPEPVTSNGLTSLQERCLVALEKTWHELDVDCLSNGFLQSVAKQSPEFLIVLLSRTLGAAQREFSNSGSGTSSKVDDVAANGDHDNADFFDAIGEPATPYDQDQIDAPPISGNDFHPISGNDFHIHDEGTPNEMVNSDDDRGPNDNGSIIDSNLESIGQ